MANARLRDHVEGTLCTQYQRARRRSRLDVLDELRKIVMTQPAQDGWWVTTKPQLRSRLYDADHQTEGRERTIRRALIDWETVGVIEAHEYTRGAGKSAGIRFRFLPAILPTHARGRSSVGSRCDLRRRRETPQEVAARRVRPWCRRTGQKGVDRYEDGPEPVPAGAPGQQPPLFSPGKFDAPGGLPGVGPLKGPNSPEDRSRMDARTRDANSDSESSAALGEGPANRCCSPGSRVELDRLRSLNDSETEEGRKAGTLSSDPVAVLLSLWERRCPGLPPKLSKEAAQQLRRSAAQLDRLNGSGQGAAATGWEFDDVVRGALQGVGPLHTAGYLVLGVKLKARAAVAGDRRRRGVRRNGRGRSGPQTGTWKSRTGEDECL
jgi:hypothetical protein